MKNLGDLKPGESTEIVKIFNSRKLKKRFLDLGLVRGTSVKCMFESPLGGMSAYKIRGALIAIRHSDCADIIIK